MSSPSNMTTGIEQLLLRIGGEAKAILIAAAIIAATIIVALLVRNLMRKSLAKTMPRHVYKPLENLIFYTIIFLGIVSALHPFGISLSGLLVAGGFAGLVVGLAAQKTFANLISGLFLLVEQPLRVGDPVSVSGVSGVVVDVGILSTRIRTWEGQIVRIPNDTVFNEVITNYVRTKARRVEYTIGIHYDSSIEAAIEALKKMMEDHPFCLVNPAPEVFVEEYADSAIVLRVRCWTPPNAWFATKIELQTRTKKVLEEAGVQIPYPQLDLHIVSAKAELPVRVKGEWRRYGQRSQTRVEDLGHSL
ncbi:MAG: mechanosensitive ion channel family protein [Pyrodictiaceae archaeon]